MLLSRFGPLFVMEPSLRGAANQREIDVYPDTHVTNIFDWLLTHIKAIHPDASSAGELERKAVREWIRMEKHEPKTLRRIGETPLGDMLREEVNAYTAQFPVGIRTQERRLLDTGLQSIGEICTTAAKSIAQREYQHLFAEGESLDIYRAYLDRPIPHTCLDRGNQQYQRLVASSADGRSEEEQAEQHRIRESIWVERIVHGYPRSPCVAIVGAEHAKNAYGLITALEEREFAVRILPYTRPDAFAQFETLTKYLIPYIACRNTGMSETRIDMFILEHFGIPDYTSSCAPITPGFYSLRSRSASP